MTKSIAFTKETLIIFYLFSGVCLGETFYISQEGNDNNSGMSWVQAWRTMKKAGSTAKAGDELIIRKGSQPYKYLPVKNSGKSGLPIIFRGEHKDNPPVLSGAVEEIKWETSSVEGVWKVNTSAKPVYVVEDGKALIKASSPQCTDGFWYWESNILYYRPSKSNPSEHTVHRTVNGGGVHINNQSWIVVRDIKFLVGAGAAINITNGSNNLVQNIHVKWYWRGVNIMGKGASNIIENSLIENNREGIYVWKGAANNTIRNNKIIHNGNAPIWPFVEGYDRSGIDIGHAGPPTRGNLIENNELAFNGGNNSDAAIIAFNAPETLIKNNYVHENYSSGINVTINSDSTKVIGNIVENNGAGAVTAGMKGIFGLSVRRSSNVLVMNNTIIGNHVSSDSRWKGKGLGPKGGLDLQGNRGDIMRDIIFRNNRVSDTNGGPDIFISGKPSLPGFINESNN